MEFLWALEDVFWIISHLYDVIVDFFIKNSIFAIRFIRNPSGEAPGEVDLLYPRNWLSILHLALMLLLTPIVAILYPFLRMRSFGNMFRPPDPSRPSDVKWFFINGIGVDHWWLDLNCRQLEIRFNVGVKGIYNRSYGLIWDIVESILQRDFGMHNASVRNATDVILQELKRQKSKKVRLIAHSQGAIIASLVIDELYRLLNQTNDGDLLSKLEVFTFANASRVFRNHGKIEIIEHYANSGDPISRVGVLANYFNNDFDGEVFVNSTTTGHLLNRYYSLKDDSYTLRTTTNSVFF